jgi:pimeloyl-ACP methyl ester carboxylesterase
MSTSTFHRPRSRDLVIALHCSAASAAQWRSLEARLGQSFAFAAPEHYDSGNAPPWRGGDTFTCADEAARTLALIDASERKVHLVGHSYGGGIALHIALARPDRIASLTLYEPSAFHLLKQFGDGAAPLAEIKALADAVATGVRTGERRTAAQAFVDYWGGKGAWDAIRPTLQDAIVRWLPKAVLEFGALFNEPTHWRALGTFRSPVLIVRGEYAPAPTRLIADMLLPIFPDARHAVLAAAGHMGPVTHPDAVNALIVSHIDETIAGLHRRAA